MSSQLMVDITEVNNSIVIPDTGTPDTGAFSVGEINDAGIGNALLPIIGVSIIMLVLFVIIFRLLFRRIRDKKRTSFAIHRAGGAVLRLTSIVLIMTIATLLTINYASIQKPADAVQLRASDTLSVTTEDIVIKVEMEDEPVFAMSESKVKVDTATTNGYKLMAYVDSDSSDLINGSDTAAKIKSLESAFSQVLTENTWGMAIVEPENQNAPVFRGIPAGLDNAIPVRVTGDVETEASDATTLYYATYVTPDLTVGKYTGATINYVAIANVFTDDITVNYHSYLPVQPFGSVGMKEIGEQKPTFDDGSTLNTVTYGRNCSLGRIDVSGDCDVVYVGNQPRISKTANVDNEGNASGYYDDDLVQVDPITFPGADMLKVELSYATESCCDYLYVLRGSFSGNDVEYYDSDVLYGANVVGRFYGGRLSEQYAPENNVTIYIEGDAMTFAFLSDVSTTSYGYYAKVTPIYFEQPNGVQTVQTTLCRKAKSNNVDEDGNMVRSYGPDDATSQAIIIPDADKIRMEITYGLFANTFYLFIEGNSYSREYYSYNENMSGTEVIDFDGNTVYLSMILPSSQGTVRSTSGDVDYGYGFYANAYPIYDKETENTLLTETCTFGRKRGDYKEPAEFNYWVMDLDYEQAADRAKYINWEVRFYNESQVISYLSRYLDYFDGQAVDLYAIGGMDENEN